MADGTDAITVRRATGDGVAAVTACVCAADLPWIAAAKTLAPPRSAA